MIEENNKLYLELKNHYNNINIHELYDKLVIEMIDLDTDDIRFVSIHEALNSVFSSKTIYNFFKKCRKCMKIIYNSGEIIFYIFDKKSFCYMIKTLLLVKRAIVTKQFLNINKKINIFLIRSPYKRFISQKSLIKGHHINGGLTTITNNARVSIYITRKEECEKVMIHEIVHQCAFINNNNFGNNNTNILKKHFNLDPNLILMPNEAIVELWAMLIYCAFISFEYSFSYNEILNIEKQHSLLQSFKILSKQNNCLWKEYTNSYCYIIFKTILLHNTKLLEKKYTYNYSPEYITNFLLNNKINQVDFDKNHEYFKKIRGNKSLRLTFLND